jgi:membrane associated rhomboid family serine protease
MRPASVGFHCPDDIRQARRTVRAPRTSVGAALLDRPPYVTAALVALNVAAYVVTGLAPGASLRDPTTPRSPHALFYDWQLQPLTVHDQHRYYELITAAFLHVSLLHIGANMLALIIVGPALERLLGWWRFAAVYLLAALGGSAAIYAFGSEIGTTVGASGAIFGLFGACLMLVRRLGLDRQWLIGIIVINFALTFSISGISKLGHIGGFVVGLLAGLAIGGSPRTVARLPTRAQVAGLAALLGAIALVVAGRSLTW